MSRRHGFVIDPSVSNLAAPEQPPQQPPQQPQFQQQPYQNNQQPQQYGQQQVQQIPQQTYNQQQQFNNQQYGQQNMMQQRQPPQSYNQTNNMNYNVQSPQRIGMPSVTDPSRTSSSTLSADNIVKIFPHANSSKSFIRLTVNGIPHKNTILNKWVLPYGAIIEPLAPVSKEVCFLGNLIFVS